MNLARQASVSSAPGLGGGRGESGLRGEAMAAALLCPLVVGGAGLLCLLLFGSTRRVAARYSASLLSLSFEFWVRVQLALARILEAFSGRLFWTAADG